ncbi:MAG: hypothetical protein KTR35_14055 [Gammaproteobacteria bacterium]|nr:hypothetical protein [Gammaproteobacteria bacterium]
MARAYPQTDLVKLVRAYGLLAGTCDAERVIAGSLSREWIAREAEHAVPLSQIPTAFFRTQRGRDVIADEIFPDQDLDPESIQVEQIDLQALGADTTINSNRLPKLESVIHGSVLAANMLLGVRLYGCHGQGMASMTHDHIVATMLQDTMGKRYLYSAFSSHDHELVDDTYIFSWFGEAVASHVRVISDYLHEFECAVVAGQTPQDAPTGQVACAVAAIYASRLRLTARAAGDQVLSFLDTESHAELRRKGIEVSGEFAERPFLEKAYQLAEAAFAMSGVDHYALREPLRDTLMIAVKDALDDPCKRERLSGRRGKAVHEVHINLPVMEYFVAAEAPNSIETVHIASLELIRSLDKGRRKSLSTMSAHAFRICSIAERVLGRALEPVIISIALLHDVVEDGSLRVTGFGHSLRRMQFRFGGPIAAMVSELTDSAAVSDGANKAKITLQHPHLLLPQAQYNVGRFTQMNLKPTEAAVPYTLSGIVIKLLDTVVSLEEGIRDPELMWGYWKHSAARIYWAERDRGEIVRPLLERLLIELKESQIDPRYRARPHHINVVRLRAGLSLLELVMMYLDMYTAQNLALLAYEYGLDVAERDTLIALFNDKNVSEEEFRTRALQSLLLDEKLDDSIRTGLLPGRGYSTLFPKNASSGCERDDATFMSYRQSALRRQEIRRELEIDTADKLDALEIRREQLLREFDQKWYRQRLIDSLNEERASKAS